MEDLKGSIEQARNKPGEFLEEHMSYLKDLHPSKKNRMKAIILTAGVARRLYPLTYKNPKCLLKIEDRPIIDYQLHALDSHGIKDVFIVVGYYREKVISYLQHNFPQFNFNFVSNEHFFETNTAYSLYLCREIISLSDFLLLNGDVLFPSDLLDRILSSPFDNILAVEEKLCGREEVKVIAGSGHTLVAIGKELIQENSLGEFIGVARFSKEFNEKLSTSLIQLIRAGGKADYFEAAIHPLLVSNHVHFVNISDIPCIEIDFSEDLEKANQLVGSEMFSSFRT